MREKIKEFEVILTRLEKASKYFTELNDEKISKLEESKEWKVYINLVHRANYLYLELEKEGVSLEKYSKLKG